MNDANKKPNLIILTGSMKSGTTSLYEHMLENFNLTRCRKKEPDIYLAPTRIQRASRWHAYIPRSTSPVLDFSTQYGRLDQKTLHERASEFHDSRKIGYIFLIREPTERLRSSIVHYYARGMSAHVEHPDFVEKEVLPTLNYEEKFNKLNSLKCRSLVVKSEFYFEESGEVLAELGSHFGLSRRCEAFTPLPKSNEFQEPLARWEQKIFYSDAYNVAVRPFIPQTAKFLYRRFFKSVSKEAFKEDARVRADAWLEERAALLTATLERQSHWYSTIPNVITIK